MTRDEYITYFNARNPPNCRRISALLLKKFEHATSFIPPYGNRHEIWENVRKWADSLEPTQYNKLVGIKEKRNRNKSEFFNYRGVVNVFPKRFDPLADQFLGEDAEQSKFYYWTDVETRNYFTVETLLRDFLALELGDALTQEAHEKIIKFTEKYNFRFIEYHHRESISYFQKFLNNFHEFVAIFHLIGDKKYRCFPYCQQPYRKEYKFSPPYTIGKISKMLRDQRHGENKSVYEKWRDIGIRQARLLDMLQNYKAPLWKKKRGVSNLYEESVSGIKFLYSDLLNKETSINNWVRCSYCNQYFFKTAKNLVACCPNHSRLVRDQRYRAKKLYK